VIADTGFPDTGTFYTETGDMELGLTVSAEEIRQYLLENYIKPAKARGTTKLTIVSGEVHGRMELKSRMPLVCEVLRSQKFQTNCNVRLALEKRRLNVKKNSSTNEFLFELL
jgi:hypothetical protein